jgi:hypothetical protein
MITSVSDGSTFDDSTPLVSRVTPAAHDAAERDLIVTGGKGMRDLADRPEVCRRQPPAPRPRYRTEP